jgi:CRISPR-associated protein Cas1
MKKLLNTLFVTTQGTYLSRDGETVLVRHEQETLLRVPIHTLGGIVCFGRVSVSPPLMGLCGERQVLLSHLSESGRFLARVTGPVAGNVLLRRRQYRVADQPEEAAAIARSIVLAKVANCRTVLLRANRDSPERCAKLAQASSDLARILDRLERTDLDVDSLRGVEGDAARTYFGVFDSLITARGEFEFRGRTRRPPLDPVNALLSFVYTLLVHDVTSALESNGLDPCVGYLHADRPGRPSLALDLMEEFRPILADRLVLSLINRRQVRAGGFRALDSGAVEMDEATRKEVLAAWQKRKQEEVQHPFINEQAPVGLLPHLQALLLARHLRGDLDAYPALVWR